MTGTTETAEAEEERALRRNRPASFLMLNLRSAFLAALAVLELPFVAFIFDPVSISTSEAWLSARVILREAVPFTLFFIVALALLTMPQWRSLVAAWARSVQSHQWRAPLAINLGLLFVLTLSTLAFNRADAGEAAPWGLFSLWCLGVGAMYAALLAAAAPLSFWRDFLDKERRLIALAAGAAMMIETAALLSRQSWNVLSEATFSLSTFILSLYEQNISTIPEKRVIGVGDFEVNIAAACSGYEGVGLVLTFLLIYFWVFRHTLKFPNVLLVLPIGVAAIWVLNSVRIAMLVSIGAHLSPEVAITGFHSQAGWMMFLAVTIAIMAITHQLSFFHRLDRTGGESVSPAGPLAAALLAPFLAMTAATIVGAAFSAENHWVYGLRVAAILLAIFAFWRAYRVLDWRVGAAPVFLGLIVGALWIATDPKEGGEGLGDWLAALPPAAMAAWLALRLLGTVILVPFAEELAFRGYLHRKLIADKFEAVAEGAFSWKALIVSSALFGVLHDRWLAGALAGAVFAAALYRSGNIGGAVVAHVAANALIAFWAIAFGQWSLL